MTWLGNSFLNLKDQIQTFSREVLAEADEDQQPKFVPAEKFNRLLKICEEKEEQLCQLQQEVYTLRDQLKVSEDGSLQEDTSNDNGDKFADIPLRNVDKGLQPEEETRDKEKVDSQNETSAKCENCFNTAENEKENSEGNHVSGILQRIGNIHGKDRVHLLHDILKEVKCLYENEKRTKLNDECGLAAAAEAKIPSKEAGYGLASTNSQPGTEETMSNDSERSDDSLLNDYEVLKTRGTSKSLDEFTLSNTEGQAQCTLMTRSTSTQSEYDFSVVNKSTQTSSDEYVGEFEENKPTDQFSEESIKLKKTTIEKHVDELNTYSKKLENFNSSLNEVSEELLDQTVELNYLYKELKSSTETKEQLRQENIELKSLIEEMKAESRSNEEEQGLKLDKLNNSLAQLSSQNGELRSQYEELQNVLSTTKKQLDESIETNCVLNEKIEDGRKTYLHRDEKCQNEIRLLLEKNEILQNEENIHVVNLKSEQSHLENLLTSLQIQLRDRDDEVEMLVKDAAHYKNLLILEKERVLRLETERESFKNEIEQLKNTFLENKTRYKRIIDDLESVYIQTTILLNTTAVNSLRSQVVDVLELVKRDDSVTTHSSIAQLVDLNERLSEEMISMNKNLDRTVKLNQKCRSQLEAFKSNGDVDAELEQTLLMNLQDEVQHFNSRIKELENMNEKLEMEIELKNRTIEQACEVEKNFVCQSESLKSKIEELNRDKNGLKNNLIVLFRNEDIVQSLFQILDLVEKYLNLSCHEEGIRWQAFVSQIGNIYEESSRLNEVKIQTERYEDEIVELKTRVAELELSASLKNEDSTQLNSVIAELEVKLTTVTSERDQVITSLKEKHSENLFYHSELQKIHALYASEVVKTKNFTQQLQELEQKSVERNNAVAELERLREHLIFVEQSYTSELLNAEDQIKELNKKVKDYEERIQTLNTAQTLVNVRANQVSESLQKEVKLLAQEKEQLANSSRISQNELQKALHDAQNLRSALDLFHRNRDSEVFHETEKFRNDIKRLENEKAVLKETVELLQTNLEIFKKNAGEKEQLLADIESKNEAIVILEKQVEQLHNTLSSMETKMADLEANTENKFKIDLLKNIFLSYATSNVNSMRLQALHILSDVLDFSPVEKRKLGLPTQGDYKQKDNDSTSSANKSLIDEFIQFVEKESDPRERKPSNKKLSAPNILFASPTSLPDVMLPTLSQHPVGQNSGYILKDILQ